MQSILALNIRHASAGFSSRSAHLSLYGILAALSKLKCSRFEAAIAIHNSGQYKSADDNVRNQVGVGISHEARRARSCFLACLIWKWVVFITFPPNDDSCFNSDSVSVWTRLRFIPSFACSRTSNSCPAVGILSPYFDAIYDTLFADREHAVL